MIGVKIQAVNVARKVRALYCFASAAVERFPVRAQTPTNTPLLSIKITMRSLVTF